MKVFAAALDKPAAARFGDNPAVGVSSPPLSGGTRLEESITIGRSVSDVYDYWRNFENFPKFCKSLKAVIVFNPVRSRWSASGPKEKPLAWESAVVEDFPDQFLSWRSLKDAEFHNTGSVRFRRAPGDRGTEIQIALTYNPRAGPLGSIIAKLAAKDPGFVLREYLRRLKQLLETGEIATTEGQPDGAAS